MSAPKTHMERGYGGILCGRRSVRGFAWRLTTKMPSQVTCAWCLRILRDDEPDGDPQ